MGKRRITADERYAAVVAALSGEPGVTVGTGRKGFGASALCVGGRIFALLSSRDRFVVKLPRPRGAELVAAGRGEPFDPGHGRLMREWLEVAAGSDGEWLPLAREAMRFVAPEPGA